MGSSHSPLSTDLFYQSLFDHTHQRKRRISRYLPLLKKVSYEKGFVNVSIAAQFTMGIIPYIINKLQQLQNLQYFGMKKAVDGEINC